MIDFSDALKRVSDSLDSNLNWAITGGANLALRTGREFVNDLDIICSIRDMPSVVDALFGRGISSKKSTCERIRSVFYSEEIGGAKIEIMGDVENYFFDAWIPNNLFLECIERRVEVGGNFVNLMSVAYEVHINALIGNDKRSKHFIALEDAGSTGKLYIGS